MEATRGLPRPAPFFISVTSAWESIARPDARDRAEEGGSCAAAEGERDLLDRAACAEWGDSYATTALSQVSETD
jgi:hypothetical protein